MAEQARTHWESVDPRDSVAVDNVRALWAYRLRNPRRIPHVLRGTRTTNGEVLVEVTEEGVPRPNRPVCDQLFGARWYR